MALKPLKGFAQGVLNEFLGLIHQEDSYARASRYEVVIQPPRSVTRPEGMNAGSSLTLGELAKNGTNRDVSLKCTQINLPGRTMTQAEDNTLQGPSRSIVSGASTYADITAQFSMLNINGQDRRFFEEWQNQAISPGDFSAKYYDDYVGEVNIYLLNEKNLRMYGIKLIEAFPKVIGDFALNGESRNQLATMDVTFSYRYWDILEGQSDLPKRIIQGAFDLLANSVENKLLRKLPKVKTRL